MKENIYELIENSKKRTKRGTVYKYKCKICGEVVERKPSETNIYKCTHKNKKICAEYRNKRLIGIYKKMVKRCYDSNDKSFKFYGNKGICICESWKNNYDNFYLWAISNGYKENLTIDRIDSSKNYEPKNCRWITREENSAFKSTTNRIVVDGITKSGIGWAKELGRGKNYINNMLKANGYDYTVNYLKKNL